MNFGPSHQRIMIHQWSDKDGPHIYLPVGPRKQHLNFLITTGAQISPITPTDAEKNNLSFKRKRVHLTGFKGLSITYSTVKVCLWLPGEK